MFELAQYHAPSTIFLDELDALASKRDGSVEHEASRRLKSELLIQLDGLAQTQERVFLLATSNLPWLVISIFTDFYVNVCLFVLLKYVQVFTHV